jgi:hypothetical protein
LWIVGLVVVTLPIAVLLQGETLFITPGLLALRYLLPPPQGLQNFGSRLLAALALITSSAFLFCWLRT